MKDWECGDASVLTAQKWPKDAPRRRKVRSAPFPPGRRKLRPLPCSSSPHATRCGWARAGAPKDGESIFRQRAALVSTPPPPAPRFYRGGRTGPFSRRPAHCMGTYSSPPMLPPLVLCGRLMPPRKKAPGAHQRTGTMVNGAFLCLSVGEGLAPPESLPLWGR